MPPRGKRPSALDYEAHLHELALKRWARELSSGDAGRAEASAARLAESPERLWRYLGLVHVAIARLARGKGSSALEALSEASACYPRSGGMSCLAASQAAHVLLETGAPAEAVERLSGGLGAGAPQLSLYLGALAHLRLAEPAAAERLESRMRPGPLAAHLRAELDGCPAALVRLRGAGGRAPGSANEAALADYGLGHLLERAGRLEEALEAFESLAAALELRLNWPIPHARSVYHAARLRGALRGADAAAAGFRTFVALWGDGELDRDEIARARQSSIA